MPTPKTNNVHFFGNKLDEKLELEHKLKINLDSENAEAQLLILLAEREILYQEILKEHPKESAILDALREIKLIFMKTICEDGMLILRLYAGYKSYENKGVYEHISQKFNRSFALEVENNKLKQKLAETKEVISKIKIITEQESESRLKAQS